MAQLKTPREFFGKQPGDDRVMIHWDELCAYYREAAKVSDRLIVEEKGKTSEGNDFLILYVSSAENLARLEEYRQISMQLADPRGLTQAEIDALAETGKAVVFQDYGIHSNEVGGPQMVPLMLYDLLTSEDPYYQKIREEVIFIISPCSEPDGEIIFTDWYHKYLGTEYEGCVSPYLRHNWAGHSNNRDALRECVIESRHLNDVIIRRFMPQIMQAHHHQCPNENRMSIAPFTDPICPHVCPLTQRETAVYGSHMALALSAAGRKGIVSGDPFFCNFPVTSFYGTALLHNVAGMLTENADVRIATPDYIDPETLKLCTVRDHVLEPCAACPDPWEGGWWHLSDIVEQMRIASVSLLDYAATNRKAVLKSMAQKALYQTKRGGEGDVKAYVITPDQHDRSAAEHLIELLHNQRVDLFRLTEDTMMNGHLLPAGSVYVPLAQPKYAVVQVMLAEEPYSKTAVKDRHADPTRFVLHDTANVCMSLTMGVATEKLGCEIDAEHLTPYGGDALNWVTLGAVTENESYRDANRRLAKGEALSRDEQGNFVTFTGAFPRIRRAKVGLLKHSATWNEEEGYTRSFLKMYDCDYRIVMDTEIREQGVPEDIEVLIIPGDRTTELVKGDSDPTDAPKEHRRGLGLTTGPVHLREYVERGGRLIVWEKACEYVLGAFPQVNMTDKARGLTADRYLTSGSQLNAVIAKADHPLTLGMPKTFTLTHSDGPVLVPTDFMGQTEILATLAHENVLKNGILRGESVLAGSPCMLCTHYGEGEIVFYTFNPEFRTQQNGTFKLLLNALYKEV